MLEIHYTSDSKVPGSGTVKEGGGFFKFVLFWCDFVYLCAVLVQIIEFCKKICVSSKKGGGRGYCTHPPGEQRVLHTSDSKVPGSGTVKEGGLV